MNIRNYSLDRRTGRLNADETILLQHSAVGWKINGQTSDEKIDQGVLERLLKSLSDLKIIGVLPKPAGVTATLSSSTGRGTITSEDRADLARKGFYIATDGQLVSSQGDVVVRTTKGVFYTLKFGEIASGATIAPTDAEPSKGGPAPPDIARESRYFSSWLTSMARQLLPQLSVRRVLGRSSCFAPDSHLGIT